MHAVDDSARRRELGDFLRSRRERLSPGAAGLRSSGRRRTPGLRREEVAELAGIGTAWYTWLEQARDIRPSEGALRHIARALQLSEVERRYLVELATEHMPRAHRPEVVTPGLVAVLHAFNGPAYIKGQRWDLARVQPARRRRVRPRPHPLSQPLAEHVHAREPAAHAQLGVHGTPARRHVPRRQRGPAQAAVDSCSSSRSCGARAASSPSGGPSTPSPRRRAATRPTSTRSPGGSPSTSPTSSPPTAPTCTSSPIPPPTRRRASAWRRSECPHAVRASDGPQWRAAENRAP